MSNKGRVKQGLTCCQVSHKLYCDKCPYRYEYSTGILDCTADLAADALELIREYEKYRWKPAEQKPKEPGWYWVYAPTYQGGSSTSREHHDGIMFAKWSGKVWSIERGYYNRPGCVEAWMFLPKSPVKENIR